MDIETPMTEWTAEELLVQRDWVRALASRLVREEAERDDLVQEAWLAALGRPRLAPAELRRWLGGVLRNRLRFVRRTDERRRVREELSARGEQEPSAAELAERAELQAVLVRAVLALPEPQRSTVLLRYFGGLTSRAIARRAGVPEGTVRSRLKRALDELREGLDRKTGGDRRSWALALVPLARNMVGGGSAPALAATAVVGALVILGIWWMLRGRLDPVEIREPGLAAAPPVGAVHAGGTATEHVQPGSSRTPLSSSGPDENLVPVEDGMLLTALDPENRPASSARVTWWDEGRPIIVHADERGECRIPGEAWGQEWRTLLRIEAEGLFHSELERGWSEHEFVFLKREASLQGRVLDAATRTPLAGATIWPFHGCCDLPTLTTDSAGSFRLDSVPIDKDFGVAVLAEGYPYAYRLYHLRDEPTGSFEVLLERGIELRGRVVDASSGEPIVGAVLRLDEEQDVLARSDADGRFLLADDEAGTLREWGFWVVVPGYCPIQVYQDASVDQLEVPLVRGAVVEGLVLDVDGRPIGGCLVEAKGKHLLDRDEIATLREVLEPGSPLGSLPARWSANSAILETVTDGEGRFRLEGLLPGIPDVSLAVSDGIHARASIPIGRLPGAGESRSVAIEMKEGGSIRGHVRSSDGPVRQRLVWRRADDPRADEQLWTRPDGSFEVPGLAPGRIELLATKGGPVRATVEVVAGSTAEIELEVEHGTIRGRVVRASGQPVAWDRVFARHGPEYAPGRGRSPVDQVTTVTDELGCYELRVPLENAPYSVGTGSCWRDGIPAGAEGIDIVVPDPDPEDRTGLLQVRARDSLTGRWIDGLLVFVREGGSEGWQVAQDLTVSWTADPYGFFQVELAAGAWQVAAGDPRAGYPLELVESTPVDPGGTARIDVEIERVPEVELVFVGPEPLLPDGTVVAFEALEGEDLRLELFRSEVVLDYPMTGRTSLRTRLSPGRYRLTTSNGLLVDPAELSIGSGPGQRIALAWSDGGQR